MQFEVQFGPRNRWVLIPFKYLKRESSEDKQSEEEETETAEEESEPEDEEDES